MASHSLPESPEQEYRFSVLDPATGRRVPVVLRATSITRVVLILCMLADVCDERGLTLMGGAS